MMYKVSKKEIPAYINNHTFWEDQNWPITPHRLYAHYHNPECDDNDIVLYYTLNEEQKISSYISVYFSHLHYLGENEKIGVASAWYSDENAKAEGVFLMTEVYEDLQGNLMSHMFDYNILKLYKAFRLFNSIEEFVGYRYFLENKKPLLGASFFEKTEKKLVNTLQESNISIEYVSVIDDDLYAFICKNNSHHLVQKSKEFFSYLYCFRWVLEAPVKVLETHNKYRFSNTLEKFGHYFIKIKRKEELIAFIILSNSNGKLKVLFSYYSDNKTLKTIAEIVVLHALKLNCKEVLCYEKNINIELQKMNFFVKKDEQKKVTMLSKKFLPENIRGKILNFGDGDSCFT